MTDAARATVWQASWKPWGEIENISGTILNNLRFPGQFFQIETGLAYNHHRHYDAVTGRYTQPDPLGFVDGPSVYAYAGNSPWMKVDPEGLATCTYSISTQKMICVPNSGGSPQSVGPSGVFSGKNEQKNCNSCTGEKDFGPTPQGNYDMVRTNKFGGSF